MRLVRTGVEASREPIESGGIAMTISSCHDFRFEGSPARPPRMLRQTRTRHMDEQTVARYIKEIGRGKKAAGDLPREDACSLFTAMLGGLVPDLQLGAILIALRVKGESLEELAGFAAACEASYNHLPGLADGSIPVVIPSYNGARQLPNLVPLVALLLARSGVPVFIHGVTRDPGRVTTREVLDALGIPASMSAREAQARLATTHLAFMPVEVMAPEIAGMLALRTVLGVRNSAHTLAKMLQPFASAAVRIVSVTHPDYLTLMRDYFTRYDTGALAFRGAEGEAVAHPRREPTMEWLHDGHSETWKEESAAARPSPELPDRDAATTARWIESVLAGKTPVPAAIDHQIACCRSAVRILSAAQKAPA
jgi:anthranilate phosphoribosyltransferase